MPFLALGQWTPCQDAARLFEAAALATPHPADIRAAQMTCFACPVLHACREFAVEAREPWGVWGGMTPRQRVVVARVRAERARAS